MSRLFLALYGRRRSLGIPPVFLSGAVVDVLSPVTNSPSGQESSRAE